MKNFTLLFVALLVVLFTTAQPTNLLIEKAEQAKERLKQTEKAGMFLMDQKIDGNLSSRNMDYFLKNAAATHKLDSTVSWTSETGIEWEYEWKEEFYYNESLRNNMWIDKEWDTITGSWYVYSQTEIEFDENGKVQTILSWYRDEPGAELLLESKMEPYYNSSGKLDSLYFYETEDGENWTLQMKQIYTYNSSDKISMVSFHVLEEGVMMEAQWTTYTYEDGNLTLMQTYFMMEGQEYLTFETRMEYNSSNQLIIEEDWSLSYTTFELEKSSRIETEYNSAGDVETETWYDWDATTETWIETEKDEYIYGSLNYSDVLYPSTVFLYDYLAVEMPMPDSKAISEIHTYLKTDADWLQTEKNAFFYSAAEASNAELVEKNNFDVFPNPVAEKVTFSWTENHPQLLLEMYRMNGAKIMEQQIISGKPVDLKKLGNGIYLYKLINENETVFTGKLVKQ